MKKKILQVILTVALVSGMSVSAADLQVDIDYDLNKINITLDTEDGYSDNILFMLADSETDMGNITSENIVTSVFDVREAAGQAGIYNVSMPFPVERGKEYKVVYENYNAVEDVGGTDVSQRQAIRYIALESEINQIFNAINSATSTSVLDEFNTYKEILDLPIEDGYVLTAENARDAELGVLFLANKPSGGYAGINQIIEGYKKALAASEILNASADTLSQVIEVYGSVFGIEATEDYNTYKGAVNELLIKEYSKLSSDKNLYGKLNPIFNEKLALTVLNNSTRDAIDKVLNKYNDIFDLPLDGKYAKLSSTEKIQFNKALERKDFSKISEVSAAFDKKLDSYKNDNSTNGGGSPSGGSSGGGNRSWTYYTPDSTENNNPSDTDAEKEQFSDINDAAWAKEAVYALVEKNIVSGYDDGSFKPNNYITRNEFIKMLVVAFNMLSDEAEYTFTDGDKNAWYAKYIASAKQAGVMMGYPDGSFGDGENITREDMAVFIYRVAQIEKVEDVELFDDDNAVSDYAKEAVYSLRSKGIVNGMDGNAFAPKELATRAQAVNILYSVLRGEN